MQLVTILQVAQIISSIGTLVAVAFSIYIANQARNEVRIDRRLKIFPIVVFKPGGHGLSIMRHPFNYRIGGCNPAAVEDDFRGLPADGQVIDNDKFYGEIHNIGAGPALNTLIEFIPEVITMGNDSFRVSDEKRTEARYSTPYNIFPSWDSILVAGAESSLTRVPTFVYLDFDDRMNNVEGRLNITYSDVAGVEHTSVQEFSYCNDLINGERHYLISFGQLQAIPTVE